MLIGCDFKQISGFFEFVNPKPIAAEVLQVLVDEPLISPKKKWVPESKQYDKTLRSDHRRTEIGSVVELLRVIILNYNVSQRTGPDYGLKLVTFEL